MTSNIVKTIIFTIVVPGTVAVVIPHAIADDAIAPTLYSSIGFLVSFREACVAMSKGVNFSELCRLLTEQSVG